MVDTGRVDRVFKLGLFPPLIAFWLFAAVLFSPFLAEAADPAPAPTNTAKVADAATAPAPAVPPSPLDELGRGTPRGTIEGFLKAGRERDYAKAAKFLDLRFMSAGRAEEQSTELARRLKIVMDRIAWLDPLSISDKQDGNLEDGLRPDREAIHRAEGVDQVYEITLQRVRRDDGVQIWKFSPQTCMQIPRMYREFGYGHLGEILPPFFFEFDILGLKAHEVIGIIVFGLISYFIVLVFMKLVFIASRALKNQALMDFLQHVSAPLKLLLWISVSRQFMVLLPISATMNMMMETKTIPIIAALWTGMRILDFIFDRWKIQFILKGQAGAPALLNLGNRVLKLVGLVIGVTIWLDNIGFKVTTVLTGLGVGGVAVALASQKSIEDIFSAVSMFISKPVRIGDFVRFDGKLGTVEEIGLRWTRVRTLERALINIPNAQFSNMHLENLTQRDRMWYHPRISVRYETTPDQMRHLLVEIRKMLYAHPKVDPDPARIRFTEFGDYALMLDIFAYVNTSDYNEYLAIAEDLNLRIMDLVKSSGAEFAFPSQTLYMGRDSGIDAETVKNAENAVTKWRQDGKLFLPDFPREEVARLRGTLKYPEGSQTQSR